MSKEAVERARLFATAAHSAVGQVRKYTGKPYICHPEHVLEILCEYIPEATVDMCAAALLHDVVEDTEITIDLIRENFGEIVANLVKELTDVSRPEDGNRATRKSQRLRA